MISICGNSPHDGGFPVRHKPHDTQGFSGLKYVVSWATANKVEVIVIRKRARALIIMSRVFYLFEG